MELHLRPLRNELPEPLLSVLGRLRDGDHHLARQMLDRAYCRELAENLCRSFPELEVHAVLLQAALRREARRALGRPAAWP